MPQPMQHCFTGGTIRRPEARVRHCARRRDAAMAVTPEAVDAIKPRLHCHRSRSFVVFRIQ
jgi:hypothetical protein